MFKFQFLLIAFIILSLTACSSNSSQPTMRPTVPTDTAAPSAVPINSPTEAPTEAIDPETGWKVQYVDGEKQLFSPDVNAWVVPDGSAYLFDHAERPYILPNSAFQMQVFNLAEKGLVVPTISQAPGITSEGNNFTSYFLSKAGYRYYGDHRALTVPKDPSDPKSDFLNALQNGTIYLTIDTAPPQSFQLNGKYRVYIVPYNEMPTGYQEIDTSTVGRYRWIARGDGTNAIGIVSSEMPWANYSKADFIGTIMTPLEAMMAPNQSAGLYTNPPQAYAPNRGDYTNSDSLRSFQVIGLQP